MAARIASLATLAHWLKDQRPRTKRAIVLATDLSIVVLAYAAALFLRTGTLVFSARVSQALIVALLTVVPLMMAFGLYNAVFRHLGAQTARRIGQAVLAFAVPWAAVVMAWGFQGLPRTLGLLYPLILWLMLVGVRLVAQAVLRRSEPVRWRGDTARALIYGAGSAGRQLAAAIEQSGEMTVVAFVDDDPTLQGKLLDRRPIVGADGIGRVLDDLAITHVLLAVPQVSRVRRNEIIGLLKPYPVQVKTLPGLMQIANGHVDATDLHDLDIEDLLGRDRVEPDRDRMRAFVYGKAVLVTGAGGSIGGELCRQLMSLGPRTLLLVERSEHALYEINRELVGEAKEASLTVELVPLLASVTNRRRMDAIMAAWRPEVLFHAAAYKHVPLVEANPMEGLRNNVLGTQTLARAAIANRVGHFVLVSTDKAVRPTNVMGASKRLAEIVLQRLALEGPGTTVLTMVRFGNVLGSSGSVVPLFRRQIASGGPVTLTHREMTRYFMLISEAAQLVIQAGAMAGGGELFLLEMGEPVRIWDLACSMIQLAGARPKLPGEASGEIELVEVGLRPGEKLYEELLIDDDARSTDHPLIRSATEAGSARDDLWERLDDLKRAIDDHDARSAVTILRELVPEFDFKGESDALLALATLPSDTPIPDMVLS